MNICSDIVLTNANSCDIMVMPRHGKDRSMIKHETKEEVLERILVKLSDMTSEEIAEFVRRCENSGIDLDTEPRV